MRNRQGGGRIAEVDASPAELARRAAARCLLEDLVEAGLGQAPRTIAEPPPAAADDARPADAAAPAVPAAAPTGSDPDSAAALAELATRVDACRACPLGTQRTCSVPGEGAPQARLMCVGEGPGAQEDAQGRPFVGPAGQLLDRILSQGMGLSREEIYITNVLKCRPPGNRDPQADEVAACSPFLQEQIRLVRPQVVLALGRHAAHHLLGCDDSLSRLRGRLHPLPGQDGVQVVVTYHPAYLLRAPEAKREAWQDVQMAMAELGLERPASGGSNPGNPAPTGS